jgi:DNA-binding NarL/FixJ family response regulator
METPRVHVQANSGFLRHALQLFLLSALGDQIIVVDADAAMSERADVVLTVDSSCPPGACQELAGLTPAVVVLAALPRSDDEARYYRAGAAAYLPMDVPADSLMNAITRVLRRAQLGVRT